MNRKNRFYVNVENKKFYFFSFYGICKGNAIINWTHLRCEGSEGSPLTLIVPPLAVARELNSQGAVGNWESSDTLPSGAGRWYAVPKGAETAGLGRFRRVQRESFLGFIGLWFALTGNEFIELSSPLRGAPSKRRSLRCSIYLSASYGMISIMKSATSGVFFSPFWCLTAPKECASELDS